MTNTLIITSGVGQFLQILIPYTTKRDDLLIGLLLACYFIISYSLAQYKEFALILGDNLIFRHKHESVFYTSTVNEIRNLIFMVIQSCILAGILTFIYIFYKVPDIIKYYSSIELIGIFTSIFMGYMIFKWTLLNLIGWLFWNKDTTYKMVESYYTIIYYIGIIMFPISLIYTFFQLNTTAYLFIGISLVIISKLLILYKDFQLFYSFYRNVLQLILYFCAVEIIPILILFKGISNLNSIL